MAQLKVDNLVFDRGNDSFTKEEFVDAVTPYMKSLERAGRTNWLCAFKYGDGSKTDVTGYETDATINATINDRCLKAEKTGGRWAVYRLSTSSVQ